MLHLRLERDWIEHCKEMVQPFKDACLSNTYTGGGSCSSMRMCCTTMQMLHHHHAISHAIRHAIMPAPPLLVPARPLGFRGRATVTTRLPPLHHTPAHLTRPLRARAPLAPAVGTQLANAGVETDVPLVLVLDKENLVLEQYKVQYCQ